MAKDAVKLTIDLRDEALHRELRLAAADLKTSMRDIVVEAVRAWLEAYEDAIDHKVAEERQTGPWISLAEMKDRLSPLDA